MRSRLSFALLSFCLAGTACAQAFDFATAFAEVEAAFHADCERTGVVGGNLMFVHGDRQAGYAAHGFADRNGERIVDLDTIWHWASCTKTFTGIAAMQLRDRGKLQLGQPIVELVPELAAVHGGAFDVKSITVRHLLSHSAGFRAATWPWGGDEPWHPHEPTQWSQLVAMLPYTQIEFAPGSKFSYSNPGIVFVGRAIERLVGEDYEVHLEKNVLRPLGMVHSYFDVTPYHLQRHRAHSYGVGPDGTLTDHGPDFDTGITVSNGGLNAPLSDMARYLMFLLGALHIGTDGEQVLARSSLAEMWLPVLPLGADSKDHIGLCFFVHGEGRARVYGHTGGQRDFVSFFYVHPASGTGALAAFNSSNAGPVMHRLRRSCIDRLSLPMTPAEVGDEVPDDSVVWPRHSLRRLPAQDGVLRLVLTVPTGGHEVDVERVVREGDVVRVELKLTTPGDGEATTDALEDHAIAVPDAPLAGDKRLEVLVATWQRGVHYVRAPDYELVATFKLP